MSLRSRDTKEVLRGENARLTAALAHRRDDWDELRELLAVNPGDLIEPDRVIPTVKGLVKQVDRLLAEMQERVARGDALWAAEHETTLRLCRERDEALTDGSCAVSVATYEYEARVRAEAAHAEMITLNRELVASWAKDWAVLTALVNGLTRLFRESPTGGSGPAWLAAKLPALSAAEARLVDMAVRGQGEHRRGVAISVTEDRQLGDR